MGLSLPKSNLIFLKKCLDKWVHFSKLLFTHHYPARCFGMNMPKSRDIQAKIPLPQAIWNEFGYVTVNGVNSNTSNLFLPYIRELDAIEV